MVVLRNTLLFIMVFSVSACYENIHEKVMGLYLIDLHKIIYKNNQNFDQPLRIHAAMDVQKHSDNSPSFAQPFSEIEKDFFKNQNYLHTLNTVGGFLTRQASITPKSIPAYNSFACNLFDKTNKKVHQLWNEFDPNEFFHIYYLMLSTGVACIDALDFSNFTANSKLKKTNESQKNITAQTLKTWYMNFKTENIDLQLFHNKIQMHLYIFPIEKEPQPNNDYKNLF